MLSGATGEAFLTGLSCAHTCHPPSEIPLSSCGSDERFAVDWDCAGKPKTRARVYPVLKTAGISDIVLRRFPIQASSCSVTGRLTLAGDPRMRLLGGNDGAFCHERSCADDGVFPDHRAVHDDGAHSDQHPVLNSAAVQHDVVTDGDVIADDEGMVSCGDMQHAEVPARWSGSRYECNSHPRG